MSNEGFTWVLNKKPAFGAGFFIVIHDVFILAIHCSKTTNNSISDFAR